MKVTLKSGFPVHGIVSQWVSVGGKLVGSVAKDGTKTISNPSEVSRGFAYYYKNVRSEKFYPTQKLAIEELMKKAKGN